MQRIIPSAFAILLVTATIGGRALAAGASPELVTSETERAQTEQDHDFKRLAIELNPLSLGIGRYSIQGEYVVAKHHAVTLNPFYAHAPMKFGTLDGGSLSGFGGELGYRFYTGSEGPNGFFVGPSVLFAAYSHDGPTAPPSVDPGLAPFTSVGGAIDIGGQFVIGPGVVLGAGAGLQYTRNSSGSLLAACGGGCGYGTADLNRASSVITEGGLRPRFLLALGYAF